VGVCTAGGGTSSGTAATSGSESSFFPQYESINKEVKSKTRMFGFEIEGFITIDLPMVID
jgi:hypothetical protein